ncbi:HNH endonuclease signature motif containing protein [Pseudomonas asplenii]|uniref:HNH endonuclease signature motif containing protein n=1 Tax=Pseudomonas asplenii TaxID=53407 RepID=UPI00068608BE|nr:HNH endonuclease signature motif containing protein [Pseudomonas fuscovaginae]
MAKKVLPTLAERLAERSIADGECLIWMGATAGKFKYGQIKVDGRMQYCHRLSYQQSKGDIPAGMLVMHTCDRPACINPDHLVLGTQKKQHGRHEDEGARA